MNYPLYLSIAALGAIGASMAYLAWQRAKPLPKREPVDALIDWREHNKAGHYQKDAEYWRDQYEIAQSVAIKQRSALQDIHDQGINSNYTIARAMARKASEALDGASSIAHKSNDNSCKHGVSTSLDCGSCYEMQADFDSEMSRIHRVYAQLESAQGINSKSGTARAMARKAGEALS
jgi:hypothetical protein